jgi:uncharacterized FAD-dependent dehydrogenase
MTEVKKKRPVNRTNIAFGRGGESVFKKSARERIKEDLARIADEAMAIVRSKQR